MSAPPPAPVVRYGDHPDQVANLHLPAEDGGPWPCMALIHGGFWRERWDRTLMTPLARDLAGRGIAAWNVEYRRVGQAGGGWPGTLDDVAAALDALADVPEVDPDRVATCGHSAGGQLALWVAATRGGRVRPRAAISLAGVCDLVAASYDRLGDGAVDALLGGSPSTVPDRYAAASPAALLPLGVPQLLVHGADDDVVPTTQSKSFAANRDADAELVILPGASHLDVVDPAHTGWAVVVQRLDGLLSAR